MVENYAGPSELHLKKELIVLRKQRFLRDPQTCSSWRSPLSSKSFITNSALLHGDGFKGNVTQEGNRGGSLALPSKSGNNGKKIYLYNWRHHSNKSSESGIKLDEGDRQVSADGGSESLSSSHDADTKTDVHLGVPVNIYSVTGSNSASPVKRTVRRLRRSSISKKGAIKHSMVSKLLDFPSGSLGIINSTEQSDYTKNCNSEDVWQSHGVTCKDGQLSCSGSPLYTGFEYGNWSSSKILKTARREGSSHSCTPASTSSYYRYGCRDSSTVGSWNETAASFDGDELDRPDLPRHQKCGIPCYWSKRIKDRGLGGCYSPSLSNILRKKSSSILCGSQTYSKKISASNKQKHLERSSQELALLTNGCERCDSSTGSASDELSTNYGELDLEAISRLDGKRWSSCKSQEGNPLARHAEFIMEMPEQRSLSQECMPRFFDEIIGQNIIIRSLSNAILRRRIAPAYLFQGPRGTGKTSTARIFAAALSCLSNEVNKPCGSCKECIISSPGNRRNLTEVDATDKTGLDRVRYLLKEISAATVYSRYKVFIIDECHMISTKMWSAFMKYLEEPLPRVVFIFITIDPDKLPGAIISRCQKYNFSKIKDIDIVSRLRKHSVEENLDIELDALELIASKSDGSLRDAEAMLEQLSLLGKKITATLVNDLVGVVADEKLLDLLEIAMSADTSETVKRSRELMDSGIDPMALMSQLAALIMDIIAGTYRLTNSRCRDTAPGDRTLTECELERLQKALKILSDAEKQLRLSSERSTWFTAALLQLGSAQNSEPHQSSSSSKKSVKRSSDGATDKARDNSTGKISQESKSSLDSKINSGCASTYDLPLSYRMTYETSRSEELSAHRRSVDKISRDSARRSDSSENRVFICAKPERLDEVWRRCIEGCHSKTLKQLLCDHGKLISINETEGILVANIAFGDSKTKSRAERFLSSITNSIEIVLRHNVEVRIGLMPEIFVEGLKPDADSQDQNPTEKLRSLYKEQRVESDTLSGSSNNIAIKGSPNFPRKSSDKSEQMLQRTLEKYSSPVAEKSFQVESIPGMASEGSMAAPNTRGQEVSCHRTKPAGVDEQRLESAWLQAAERNTPGLLSHPKPEKNQVLPQNDSRCQNGYMSSTAIVIASKHSEDELNYEMKTLKVSDVKGHQKNQIGEKGDYVISPSLLHSNNSTSNFDKANLGYESGPGSNGLLCWKTRKSHGQKVKQGISITSKRTSRYLLFGECVKSKEEES
ncbi:protein STICHEL-like 1 [Typha angustifolia]|uniref:protein STICHEL-like 1 n=1 Tax=Typha angustifolia TaxID=59011 RepID=UPI003C2CD58E